MKPVAVFRQFTAIVAFVTAAMVIMPANVHAAPSGIPDDFILLTSDDMSSVNPGVMSGYTLKSVDSDAAGRCMDIYNWGVGPWVQMYACHGGTNQDWRITAYTSSTWKITSFDSDAYNKCVDGYAGLGKQLTMYPCDTTTDQQFWVGVNSIGQYIFESVDHPGQCIDIYNWGIGTQVQLYTCHGGTNQRWIYRS